MEKIIFLKLSSPKIALSRIRSRVAQGGHAVRKADVVRRFTQGWDNFEKHYRDLADRWVIYDASGPIPVLLTEQP
jgi:predicted ABC-type ATPase